ncbi:porin [Poriferisphaera sp. WC338]|uniref:porin n=1 Tax=Poriferisphaera sp. WC338 TaxID=3425129 RepID=UPI003D818AF4
MLSKKTTALIAGAMAVGMTGQVMAEDAGLRSELAAVKARLAAMEQANSSEWLNERRAEEVKGLIRDVLSDADTRATLLQDGVLAGNENGKFFLKSADGNFKMNIGAQLQVRYIAQFQNDRQTGVSGREDKTIHAFNVRRAKLKFSGTAFDPAVSYKFVLSTSRSTGNVMMEDAVVGWKMNDQWKFEAGVQKVPFLREELVSSSRLLAVDRASVTEFFTLDRATGLFATWTPNDDVKVRIAATNDTITDAGDGYTPLGAMGGDISLTARADVKLAGDWKQSKDYVAWQGGDQALFAGAAVNWQRGDRGQGVDTDYVSWTIDGLFKCSTGWTASAALSGAHSHDDAGSGGDWNAYGVLTQLAYNINDKWQPYVRYEMLNVDSKGADQVQGITVGTNYFIKKHNLKFTTDLVWMFDGMAQSANVWGANPFSSGLGLNGSGADKFDEDSLIAARAQVQLAF